MALLLIVFGIILYLNLADKHGMVEVENVVETPATATSTEVTVERDLIDEAKAELERINAELDAEEMRLLEEIEMANVEREEKVNAAQERLDEIERVRASL